MNRYGLFVVLLTIVVASAVIPAYAEVTSLKTNTSFYKGGSKINFTGSTLDTDPPNVTILLFDPANKFILLSSGVTNSNHQFQVVIDTSTSDNQQKFLLKGVYNATAFIATKENGKTVNFIYSPDGSPVVSSPPTSLTSSSMSSTEIDLSWTAPVNTGGASLFGYKIERDNGTGFVQIQNVQSTTYHDTGLTPSKLYSYRVSAVNQAGTSSPSNVATSVTLSPPVTTTTPPPTTTTPDQSTGLSLEEQIKQRLAVAQKIQQLLHGQNPTPSDTTGVKQTVTLSESLVLDDMAVNLGSQKSGGSFVSLPSGITNFDASALLYPAIILAGVVIVVAILYMRKKQRLSDNLVETRKETFVPVEITPEPQEDDHAMMILKNRLAKGEITIDEFKALKDELLEP